MTASPEKLLQASLSLWAFGAENRTCSGCDFILVGEGGPRERRSYEPQRTFRGRHEPKEALLLGLLTVIFPNGSRHPIIEYLGSR